MPGIHKNVQWLSILLPLALFAPLASAAPDIPLFSVSGNEGSQEYSTTLQILLLLSAMSFLPALLLVLTSFTRVVIVLSMLRQAIGLQQSPPNPVIVGLALFLTLFIMQPVFDQAWQQAVQPWMAEELSFQQAIEQGSVPFREFMLSQTRPSALNQMSDIAALPAATSVDEVPMTVLIPAFVISELTTAFQIGFMLFIPFLVIDLVVASVLMAMGMMMLSPLVVSLPFKIMLFVLVDGWSLIVGTLAASYQ
ncbi:flagellar biosynthetic protein FliP [Endozoicomonas sp. OPT23]|uniref:flagellar type III secretion system pore protein FliP n=1 Tax=Endozoicomonas sp. OPT23 TaxID=2072845 RepID=UPI00129AB919|nr:flagellar type III secretion system pore protein FliP [Endozoicomonas sp. OPT23]MRI33949.1 flagellar biosynthetic protein FliP [Endozoicomonas sp. OPT23]